ncbi:MAG TPA: hypothetical protein VGY54_02020 [Polyangiaceae bacterium]|jgi:hypothetical protein|nr:hypothetical protein [Polyangiaceae bacterium]
MLGFSGVACATTANSLGQDSGAIGPLTEGGASGAMMNAGAGGEAGQDASVSSAGEATETGPLQEDATGDSTADAIGDAIAEVGTSAMPSSDATVGLCPAGALLCDDFEKYMSAADLAAAWRVTATAATLQVDATKPFKGNQGLHISAPGGGTHTAVIVKEGAPIFPIPGNIFFGRMMVWVNQVPTGGVHWNNVQSAGLLPNSTQTAKYGWGGMFGTIMAGYTVRNDPAGAAVVDCSKSSAMTLPVKRWVCVEWKFDGAADEMHYWFDGQLLADVDVIKTGTTCVTPQPPGGIWHAPVFSNLTLGWAQYQASPVAIDMWIDEVAVHTQRVGCP